MSEQRLRDCPFCGGNAVECFSKVSPQDMTSNAWAEGYVLASIACGKCGARAKQYSLDTGSRVPSDADVQHALLNATIHWTARIDSPELTAAQSRVAELEAQNSNLAMLVQRLVRRARHFDASCRVAKQALDYLVRNNLMPSVLRGEIIDE